MQHPTSLSAILSAASCLPAGDSVGVHAALRTNGENVHRRLVARERRRETRRGRALGTAVYVWRSLRQLPATVFCSDAPEMVLSSLGPVAVSLEVSAALPQMQDGLTARRERKEPSNTVFTVSNSTLGQGLFARRLSLLLPKDLCPDLRPDFLLLAVKQLQ